MARMAQDVQGISAGRLLLFTGIARSLSEKHRRSSDSHEDSEKSYEDYYDYHMKQRGHGHGSWERSRQHLAQHSRHHQKANGKSKELGKKINPLNKSG